MAGHAYESVFARLQLPLRFFRLFAVSNITQVALDDLMTVYLETIADEFDIA